MSILFSTQTGDYLQSLQKDKMDEFARRSLDLRHLIEELERLENGDESVLIRSTHANLDDDIYLLNISGFIVTLIKRPNGDFLVTDIRMAAVPKDN